MNNKWFLAAVSFLRGPIHQWMDHELEWFVGILSGNAFILDISYSQLNFGKQFLTSALLLPQFPLFSFSLQTFN